MRNIRVSIGSVGIFLLVASALIRNDLTTVTGVNEVNMFKMEPAQ